MPINRHLSWFEVREFGGLWTAGEQSLMPANKAQVMSGCHPQVGGGLRSFLKVTETVPGNGLNLTKLTLPGVGTAYAHTPDSFLSGANADIRIELDLTDWTPANPSIAIGDLDVPGFDGWEVAVLTDTKVQFAWGTGAAILNVVSSAAIETLTGGVPQNGDRIWIRVLWNGNDGAGNRVTKFYASADGSTWEQFGATSTVAGTSTISASAQQLRVGVRPDGTFPLDGTVYRAEAWTLAYPATQEPVAAVDFTNQTVGAGSFTDRQGRTWTIAGTAAIADQSATLQQAVGFGISVKATAASGESEPLFYLVTVDDPGGLADNWRVFSYDAPNDPVAQWTSFAGVFEGQSYSGDSPTPSTPAFARLFVSPYSKDLLGLSLREEPQPFRGSGVYHLRYDRYAVKNVTGVPPLVDSYGASAMVEHQSRLVIGHKDLVRFTAPESLDFDDPGSGFVRLNPQGWEIEASPGGLGVHEGPLVAWMVSVPPGDLIVATRDGRIYNVQGDLGDPTVRELGRWTTMLPHEPASTPNGIYFVLPNQGVHRLGLDGGVENTSADILPAVWNIVEPKVGLGQLAGTERFLFAPNQHTGAAHKNGALVYDHDTNAWFTSTHTDDYTITNPRLMQPDNNPQDSGIWIATSQPLAGTASPAVLWHIRTGGAAAASLTTEARNSTWEWKSSPLRDPEGRYVEVREIQIPVHAFNDDTSTLAVTVDGTTVTRTLESGRSVETFLFRKRGEFLDVTVKAKSNDTGIEAPMIEAVRVGWKPGPRI